MTSNNASPDDLSVSDPGDGPDSAVIYPLVASSGNERVLKDWLADHDTYRLADESRPVCEAEFDLCIVDHEGLQAHSQALRDVKSATHPVLVPVLLLLPEQRREIIESDQGRIADNVFATTVDEIVSLPIRQTELEWRIKALLRLRKQSQQSQAKTEKLRRFRKAVESSGHAIFITDVDGTIEYANPAFADITGYDPDAVVGKTPEILESGEMSEEFFAALWETVLSGEVWEAEIVNERKDGEQYTAYQTIAPITDEDGTIEAFVAVQTDITERKELRDRLKRHRDIVQRLEDPIMLQGNDGTFELVNDAVAEFAGVDPETLLGTDELTFMDDETAATIAEKKQTVVETETPVSYTVEPTFELSGKAATFSTRRYPYYDEDGDLTGTIAICRDVTEREEQTRQLRVIDNILRHNLRNSLTVIRNKASEVRDQVDDDLADDLETITAHVDDLETTGEKSRAITRVLSREVEQTHVDIGASIRSLADTVAAGHPDADITVTGPASVTLVATYNLDRAVEELVRNAIVHNDQESPAVTIAVEDSDDTVEIQVTDNGPGLPAMEREVLETGRAIEDLYHGSGLGLWLVYWIVERTGGSIEVSDADPRGTEVRILLPRGSGQA